MFKDADFSNLAEAWRAFLAGAKQPAPRAAALAVACPVRSARWSGWILYMIVVNWFDKQKVVGNYANVYSFEPKSVPDLHYYGAL